jgi:magnesium-transporting ATPase (P-type)
LSLIPFFFFLFVRVQVAIISLTPLSPKTPIVSVAPLALVLAVSAIKEAIEDFQRYKLDKQINATIVEAWRTAPKEEVDGAAANGGPQYAGTGFEAVAWADLQVGDVVFVREGNAFPADIILLQSSGEQGIAHIDTASLDGETALKSKAAVPECWHIPTTDNIVGPNGVLMRRGPSRRQLSDGGAVSYRGSNGDEGLSSRSNPSSRSESAGLRWPMKLPPLLIESSAPSKKLDGSAWKANMTFLGPERDAEGNDIIRAGSAAAENNNAPVRMALGMQQLLLRGCILRNTKWVVGVVMFTGVETKLMLNNRASSFKRSHVDRIVDQSLYLLFTVEALLCTFGAVANYIWMDAHRGQLWWLPDVNNIGAEAGLSWFTYLVLLDILIPISLYVSMELVKAMQAHWINKDLAMYHPETNTPAHARTSALQEELGQVNWLFSDKTGTLTSNVMNFMACSIDGKMYGMDGLKVGGAAAAGPSSPKNGNPDAALDSPRAGSHHDELLPVPSFKGLPPPDASFPFKDSSLVRALLGGSREAGGSAVGVDKFLTLLSVCHTVLPDFPGCMREHVHTLDENCKFAVVYQASSPDEKALVEAAKNQGYYFYHREPAQIKVGGGMMSVNGEKVLVNILGHVTPFLLLDSFEFSSERARMSVIVLDPRDGDIKVLTKGADQKMYKLLNEESRSSRVWSSTENGLKQFAGFGLRTLVCGMKVLSEDQYVSWASEYAKAKANVERREELVAHWQNEIEQGLTYVGTTAIEDRLQDGVPECISTLLAAGLKIWILTGDKVETAINIARSCSLVTPSMDSAGLLELIVDDKLSDEEALKSTQAQLAVALKRVEQEAGHLPAGQASDSLAIVVSGLALTHIFSVVRDERGREILYENLSATQRREADVLRDQFMVVASRCSAVVCCRVSPNQKAEVVSLVKNKQPNLITLAIGDGANDVSMIKTAHIGVGISGLEGLQAVMASDYSIAQVG